MLRRLLSNVPEFGDSVVRSAHEQILVRAAPMDRGAPTVVRRECDLDDVALF